MAKEVGFDVTVFKPTRETPLREAYAVVNSSHVMVGVHGAALTHAMFLRRGSVFVQVVPIGVEGAAEWCFGWAAKGFGLDYMEYRIMAEESSLTKEYGKENALVKDSRSLLDGKWLGKIMNIYLKRQNVTLNLNRFRVYLEKAYDKAKKLMANDLVT